MNKNDPNFDDDPWVLGVIEAIKKEYPEKERTKYLTWTPRLIESLTLAEALMLTIHKVALDGAYLPVHVKYRFGKQTSRYSLCGFFRILLTLCQEITDDCTKLSGTAAKSGAEADRLNEDMVVPLMTGKTTRHYRIAEAAADKLLVIKLAMNCLLDRLHQLVETLKQNSDVIITIKFQKIYRDLYAVKKVSKEAVGNMGRLTALEETGNTHPKDIAKRQKAEKFWKSLSRDEKRSERRRKLAGHMGISTRRAGDYIKELHLK